MRTLRPWCVTVLGITHLHGLMLKKPQGRTCWGQAMMVGMFQKGCLAGWRQHPSPGANQPLLLLEGRIVEPSGAWTLEASDAGQCPNCRTREFALLPQS